MIHTNKLLRRILQSIWLLAAIFMAVYVINSSKSTDEKSKSFVETIEKPVVDYTIDFPYFNEDIEEFEVDIHVSRDYTLSPEDMNKIHQYISSDIGYNLQEPYLIRVLTVNN